MSTAEILSKLTAKTSNYEGSGVRGTGGDDLRWQDIAQAAQGIDSWKMAFMFCVYAGDSKSRYGFFAGLFMEVMERPETQLWIRHRKEQGKYIRGVEKMCQLSITEWTHWNIVILEIDRADHMGVSLSTWKRKYKPIYEMITAIPTEWENEIMKIISKRLK
ncbi:MAG: hypothetical protein ACI9GW_001982 [Halieaceae bacterium]|jgi:hypothetical protein